MVETADTRLFDEKRRFIDDQTLASCVAASFQHAHVYADDALDRHRVHIKLKEELRRIGGKYGIFGRPVESLDHVGNIVELSERMSEDCRSLLAGGRFRLGIAQKSLNLYLKYLWCLRWIPMPPHCPFDRLIINRISKHLPQSDDVSWTKLDKVSDYEDLVAAATREADGKPLAEWELDMYHREYAAARRTAT